MERLKIEDIFDLASLMYVQACEGDEVEFVGKYDDVQELIGTLSLMEDVVFDRIELEPIELNGYDREYYVDLDTDLHVWIEKAYSCDHEAYLISETDVLYIADDCNSKILDRIDYEHAVEVTYEDDEPECDCERCHLGETDKHEVITRVATDDTGKLRGFEKSWSTNEDGLHYHTTYSFFSDNEKMLKDMLDNFKIKY